MNRKAQNECQSVKDVNLGQLSLAKKFRPLQRKHHQLLQCILDIFQGSNIIKGNTNVTGRNNISQKPLLKLIFCYNILIPDKIIHGLIQTMDITKHKSPNKRTSKRFGILHQTCREHHVKSKQKNNKINTLRDFFKLLDSFWIDCKIPIPYWMLVVASQHHS